MKKRECKSERITKMVRQLEKIAERGIKRSRTKRQKMKGRGKTGMTGGVRERWRDRERERETERQREREERGE